MNYISPGVSAVSWGGTLSKPCDSALQRYNVGVNIGSPISRGAEMKEEKRNARWSGWHEDWPSIGPLCSWYSACQRTDKRTSALTQVSVEDGFC